MNKDTKDIYDFLMDAQEEMLNSILTINEVSVMWGKTRRTVEMAFWKGQIKGRQGRNTAAYLISRASCVENWGPPIVAFEDVK